MRNLMRSLMLRVGLIGIVGLLTLTSGEAWSADFYVTAKGSIYCVDPADGSVHPLDHVLVQSMDSDDPDEDDLLGQGFTNPDGSFEILGRGGDWGSLDFVYTRPDVYIRVVFVDEPLVDGGIRGVALARDMSGIMTFDSIGDLPRGVGGVGIFNDRAPFETVDFGSWTLGVGTECMTFIRSHSANQEYITLTGEEHPKGIADALGHFVVHYMSRWDWPKPETATVEGAWPFRYPSAAAKREYGFSIRNALDETFYVPPVPHSWFGDYQRFRYHRENLKCDSGHLDSDPQDVKEAFAFEAGWGHYWGDEGGCIDHQERYNNFDFNNLNSSFNPLDLTNEGDVAFALSVLSSCPGVGKAGMVRVLKNHPGVIHSFNEFKFFFDQEFPNACAPTPLRQSFSPDHQPVPLEFQRERASEELAAQEAAIRDLTVQFEQARAAASEVSLTCQGADCFAVSQVLIKPPMLDMKIRWRNLARNSLQTLLQQGDEISQWLTDGTFFDWLAEQSRVYSQEVARIEVIGLQGAIQAAIPLAERSPDANPLLGDLRTQLARVEEAIRLGQQTTLQMQPWSLLAENQLLPSPAVVNHPPSKPELVSPANGQTGLATPVTFRWKKATDPDGDTVTYEIHSCTKTDFSGCTPLEVASLGNAGYRYAGMGNIGLMIFGVVLSGLLTVRRRRIGRMTMVLILVGFTLISCDRGGDNTPAGATDEVSRTVSGLTPGTTYYWVVVAKDGEGGQTESDMFTFTTQ